MTTVKFEHSLPTDDLIIRQNANIDSDRIEDTFGKSYPIVRLKDAIFNAPSIKSFSMSFTSDQLTIPVINIDIDDDDHNQRDNNFVEKGSIMTVFVGNAKDTYHKPIKNNYYIVDSTVDDDTGSYIIEAILDVKDLYYSQNRVFVNKSSLEVFEFIAKECKLGLITNMTATNDKMNWIQYQPNINFLTYVAGRSFSSNDTKILVFIDQFANLNVIDLKSILQDSSKTTFLTDQEGLLLEKDSTFKMTNWKYGDKENDRFAKIDSLSPVNDVGKFSRRFSEKIDIRSLDILTSEISDVTIDSSKKQLRESSTYTSFVNDNTFKEYDYAKQLNGNYNNHLLEGQRLNISTGTFYPQLFMMLGFDIDVYNEIKITESENQEQTVTLQNFDEKVDTENKSLDATKNEMLSGKYIVKSMSYFFTFSNSETNQIRQSLTVLKLQS